jgi:uroporphyrinogen decarboxylase
MSPDKLTPKERIGAFLQGERPDRVPCTPLILNHASRVLGVTVGAYNRDGQVMGQAHVAAFRRYRHDMITIFTDTAILAEAMGTTLHYPDDDAAYVETPVVREPEDVEKVRRADPWQAGRMPVYLEAIQVCNGAAGDEVFTACCYAAPFTTAACLRGTDQFARDLRRNPALAHALLKLALEVALDFTDAVVEAGGVPVLVDPVATGSMISEPLFREFAEPYIAPLCERIRAHGFPAILHICGKTHRLWEAMADTGANVLSLDQADLAEAKSRVGHRVCLMGNVRPAQTLLNGTPEQVDAEAKACLEVAGDSPGGFILASGCEVPLHTPPENVDALMNAARKYGRYL